MISSRTLLRVIGVVLGLVAVTYAADWAVLRARVSHGTAYGTVVVNQLLATPLKGNKMEYDVVGTAPESCTHSLFPQMGQPACWWLERHATQWQ